MDCRLHIHLDIQIVLFVDRLPWHPNLAIAESRCVRHMSHRRHQSYSIRHRYTIRNCNESCNGGDHMEHIPKKIRRAPPDSMRPIRKGIHLPKFAKRLCVLHM
eukprot:scaffold13560_cov161-Cylindrotheca_fusiformis.AAC.1